MRYYCLCKRELEQLVACEVGENPVYNYDDSFRTLRSRISDAKNWYTELIAFTYFLAKVLEKKSKKKEMAENLGEELKKIYDLEEHMWLTFQEFDRRFIKFLLKNPRNESLSLEDEIVQIQEEINNLKYG